jgi:YVTN family beta-propeller protein
MRIQNQARAAGVGLIVAMLLPFAAFANRVYVSNEDGHSVTVIDGARGKVIATVPIGKRPRGLKLNADASQLYVAVSGLPKCPPSVPDEECEKMERDLKADGIAVMDTKTLKVLRVLQAGSDPEQFDLSHDGKLLYVANEDTGTMSVVDIASGRVKTRITVGKEPEGVVLSPDGRHVCVTNESDNSITIIDTKTLEAVSTVQVGKRPRDLVFTPDGKLAYATGEFDSSLYRVGMPGGKPVEKVLELGQEARPMTVLMDAPRKRLYVSTGRGGSVAVIATEPAVKLLRDIPVGKRPWGIALTPDASLLYTANGPSNDVSVIDTARLAVVAKIPVGQSPWGIVVGP